jgi:Tol biopolymer transport system component
MSRKNGALTRARITIRRPTDSVELIAHEIEHVIEQLDGVVPGDLAGARSTHDGEGAYESARAREAGLFVAREVREARGRVVSHVIGQDHWARAVDPAAASVSANGRFMAFTSLARLTADDQNDTSDLYVYDIQDGRTTLESPPTGWSQRYRPQLYPHISGDGGRIVFQAVDRQGPEWWQTVVLDRQQQSVRVLSVNGNHEVANGHCTQAAISADGSTVVFESLATNLVAGDANGPVADIFAVRLDGGHITRVSVRSNGTQPVEGHSITPSISADGRWVSFTSAANLACDSACGPQQDRRLRHLQIFLRDLEAGTTTRVSLAVQGKEPNGASTWPALSGNGRLVAFVSEASNLVADDANSRADVFVHDIATGRTEIVSHRSDGAAGNGPSARPALSFDGQIVAFQSLASDLTCADHCGATDRDINLLWDVFVFDRSTAAMVRASMDDTGEWLEPSRTPSIDASGTVMVFASRHPTDDGDIDNDEDFFVWLRGSLLTARGAASRPRAGL